MQRPNLRTPQPHHPRAPEQDDAINPGAREEHDLKPDARV